MRYENDLNDADRDRLERKLQADRYRLTQKLNEKHLAPGEYLKRSHGPSREKFDGPIVWDIIWCPYS